MEATKTYPNVVYYNGRDYSPSNQEIREHYISEFEQTPEEDMDFFFEWVHEASSEDFNDFIYELKYSDNNVPCVILGTLGLWNGRREIIPCRMMDVVSAIKKCLTNIDVCKIELVNGEIHIEAIHHDGTNKFVIRMLTNRGIDAKESADLTKKCYTKRFRGYLLG